MNLEQLQQRLAQAQQQLDAGHWNESQLFDRETIQQYDAQMEADDPFELNRPHLVHAHTRIGAFAKDQGNYEETSAQFEAALACEQNNAIAHFDRSLLRLLFGEFVDGWREYEWRFQSGKLFLPAGCTQVTDDDNYPCPNVTVADFDGRRVALHSEQGYGDRIQFVRYARLVHDAGAEVVVRCQPTMVRLFQTCSGVHTTTDALPAADIHLPLMSLPFLFGTELNTVPDSNGYLSPPPDPNPGVAAAFEGVNQIRIGLVWRGSKYHIPVQAFQPLSGLPNVALYGLQLDAPPEDLAYLNAQLHATDLSHLMTDFAESAAIVSHLHLVITVDTAMAHLAGSLNRRVWVLLNAVPDWQWLLGTNRSPWYSSVRLFRAPAGSGLAEALNLAYAALIPTQDELRVSAYEIWHENGCVHGMDQRDWFDAWSRLLLARINAP